MEVVENSLPEKREDQNDNDRNQGGLNRRTCSLFCRLCFGESKEDRHGAGGSIITNRTTNTSESSRQSMLMDAPPPTFLQLRSSLKLRGELSVRLIDWASLSRDSQKNRW